MKIFSVSQIRAADAFTIEHEPISSINLMERAARACYDWFHLNIKRDASIGVLCGKGNNGGDGLALARMLARAGYTAVSVYVLEHAQWASEDFLINYERLKQTAIPTKSCQSIEEINPHDIYVDSILGSGLNKPLRGMLADVVNNINQHSGFKISIDIPTGLFADSNAQNSPDSIFQAHHTLSFQFPKWSFLFPEFGAFAGSFYVLDIGLSAKYIGETETNNYLIDQSMVDSVLPIRRKFDHKGTFGHALIIAGSKGKIGAVTLASRAAIRSGAGLVSAYVPQCGLNPLQAANPEIMVLTDNGHEVIESILYTIAPSSVGIGPGLGTAKATVKALEQFVANQKKPVVIDADGLNCLVLNGGIDKLPKNSILTPHLGELDRLLGERYRGEDVYHRARKFALEKELILLVKGAHSAIYTPSGNVYFNATGTNGMATAGSGDVLTGLIAGFLAQGIDPVHAAVSSVYFHGLAGQRAAQIRGNASMTAVDLLDNLKIEL